MSHENNFALFPIRSNTISMENIKNEIQLLQVYKELSSSPISKWIIIPKPYKQPAFFHITFKNIDTDYKLSIACPFTSWSRLYCETALIYKNDLHYNLFGYTDIKRFDSIQALIQEIICIRIKLLFFKWTSKLTRRIRHRKCIAAMKIVQFVEEYAHSFLYRPFSRMFQTCECSFYSLAKSIQK